jgi:hypothetical protein
MNHHIAVRPAEDDVEANRGFGIGKRGGKHLVGTRGE